MGKFPKLILTIATYSFIVTLISLIIGFLSKEDSTVQSISSGIGLYGTIITIYVLLFHLLIVFISFIIKSIKFSKLILNIATYTFIASIVSFIICFIANEDSTAQVYFSGIAFYGIIITFYTLLFHLLIVFISFIIKNINHPDNK